jgi:hypothetical protein
MLNPNRHIIVLTLAFTPRPPFFHVQRYSQRLYVLEIPLIISTQRHGLELETGMDGLGRRVVLEADEQT